MRQVRLFAARRRVQRGGIFPADYRRWVDDHGVVQRRAVVARMRTLRHVFTALARNRVVCPPHRFPGNPPL